MIMTKSDSRKHYKCTRWPAKGSCEQKSTVRSSSSRSQMLNLDEFFFMRIRIRLAKRPEKQFFTKTNCNLELFQLQRLFTKTNCNIELYQLQRLFTKTNCNLPLYQ